MNQNKLLISFCIIFICTIKLIAQSETSLLESKGEIPQFFINSLDKNFEIQREYYDDFLSKKEEIKDLKEEVLLMSALDKSFHFKNGKMLFGDEISSYLNSIKNEILKDKPELKKSIQIYLLKSNIVNAYCTLEGQIYFSIGLFSRISNEAELAFVIAHEIGHYEAHHAMVNIESEADLEKVREKRKDLSFDDIYRIRFKRSKEYEYEADQIGANYIKNSIYKYSASYTLMDILSKSEYSMFNEKVGLKYFDSDFFQLPIAYTREKVDSIEIDLYSNDLYRTHPNIGSRKENLKKNELKQSTSLLFNLKNEEEFEYIRNKAIIHQIRANIIGRNYVEAYYDACVFLRKNPESEELRKLKAQAIYCISRYKNKDCLHYATPGYLDIQGESQQFHYIFKSLNARQLNTYAIKEMYNAKKKLNTSILDSMIVDLMFDLYKEHDLTKKSYFNEEKSKKLFQNVYSKSQKITEIAFKEQRKLFRDFYLLGFAYELNDNEFVRLFELAEKKYRIYEDWVSMDYKIKNKKIEKIQETNEIKHKSSKILLLSPDYFRYNKDFLKSAEKTYNESRELESILMPKLKEINSKIDLLSILNLKKEDVQKYNEASLAMDWLNERFNHIQKANVRPLLSGEIQNSFLVNYDYLCKVTILNSEDNSFYYMILIFNIDTGELAYKNVINTKKRTTVNGLVNYIVNDFKKF